MELAVIGSAKTLSVSDAVFGREFSEDLVHQVVVAFRNAGRAGTKAQLTRSEVSGTTKKFKKQKGGGARHGDYRAPIFVGGGVSFAAKPRSFAQKVNRKMYRAAVCAIISELNRQGRLKIVDAFDVTEPKTKALVAKLAEMGVSRPLIVSEEPSEALYLAARNVPYVQVLDAQTIDPVTNAQLTFTDSYTTTNYYSGLPLPSTNYMNRVFDNADFDMPFSLRPQFFLSLDGTTNLGYPPIPLDLSPGEHKVLDFSGTAGTAAWPLCSPGRRLPTSHPIAATARTPLMTAARTAGTAFVPGCRRAGKIGA